MTLEALDRLMRYAWPGVAVEESEMSTLPSGYALFQNHPNPFNPVTVISYTLPQASHVTLTLYALTGQKVATLVSGVQEAGHYRVRWDGSGWAQWGLLLPAGSGGVCADKADGAPQVSVVIG